MTSIRNRTDCFLLNQFASSYKDKWIKKDEFSSKLSCVTHETDLDAEFIFLGILEAVDNYICPVTERSSIPLQGGDSIDISHDYMFDLKHKNDPIDFSLSNPVLRFLLHWFFSKYGLGFGVGSDYFNEALKMATHDIEINKEDNQAFHVDMEKRDLIFNKIILEVLNDLTIIGYKVRVKVTQDYVKCDFTSLIKLEVSSDSEIEFKIWAYQYPGKENE